MYQGLLSAIVSMFSAIAVLLLGRYFATIDNRKSQANLSLPSSDEIDAIYSSNPDVIYALKEKQRTQLFTKFYSKYPGDRILAVVVNLHRFSDKHHSLESLISVASGINNIDAWAISMWKQKIRSIFIVITSLVIGVVLVGLFIVAADLYLVLRELGALSSPPLARIVFDLAQIAVAGAEISLIRKEQVKLMILSDIFDSINKRGSFSE